MTTKCPNCGSEENLRIAIYGMPAFPIDQTKYYIAGCTATGPKYVCLGCKFGLEEDGRSVGERPSRGGN